MVDQQLSDACVGRVRGLHDLGRGHLTGGTLERLRIVGCFYFTDDFGVSGLGFLDEVGLCTFHVGPSGPPSLAASPRVSLSEVVFEELVGFGCLVM